MPIIDKIPESRIKIHYKTEVNGKKKEKELPFRLLVLGDLSLGYSKDRQVDFEEREMRTIDSNSSIGSLMNDMDMSLKLEIDNKINPSKKSILDIDLPIRSIKSLDPSTIAGNVPEIQSLMQMKKMIKELESYIDNNKKFRSTIFELMKDKGSLECFKKYMPDLSEFKI